MPSSGVIVQSRGDMLLKRSVAVAVQSHATAALRHLPLGTRWTSHRSDTSHEHNYFKFNAEAKHRPAKRKARPTLTPYRNVRPEDDPIDGAASGSETGILHRRSDQASLRPPLSNRERRLPTRKPALGSKSHRNSQQRSQRGDRTESAWPTSLGRSAMSENSTVKPAIPERSERGSSQTAAEASFEVTKQLRTFPQVDPPISPAADAVSAVAKQLEFCGLLDPSSSPEAASKLESVYKAGTDSNPSSHNPSDDVVALQDSLKAFTEKVKLALKQFEQDQRAQGLSARQSQPGLGTIDAPAIQDHTATLNDTPVEQRVRRAEVFESRGFAAKVAGTSIDAREVLINGPPVSLKETNPFAASAFEGFVPRPRLAQLSTIEQSGRLDIYSLESVLEDKGSQPTSTTAPTKTSALDPRPVRGRRDHATLILDGDNVWFHPKYMRMGWEGGATVFDHVCKYFVRKHHITLKDLDLRIRVFLNMQSQARLFQSIKVVERDVLRSFWQGLLDSNVQNYVVDVGSSNQAADGRVAAALTDAAMDSDCSTVYLGGLDDFGYVDVLRKLRGAGVLDSKVHLIQLPGPALEKRKYEDYLNRAVFDFDFICSNQRMMDVAIVSIPSQFIQYARRLTLHCLFLHHRVVAKL